jgi:hypothetical protein
VHGVPHAAAPTSENLPAAQGVQAELPAAENVSRGHGMPDRFLHTIKGTEGDTKDDEQSEAGGKTTCQCSRVKPF